MRLTLRLALPLAALIAATPALAMDLNSYRAAHGRMPLTASSELIGIAYAHAVDLARRQHLDHRGFRQRLAPGDLNHARRGGLHGPRNCEHHRIFAAHGAMNSRQISGEDRQARGYRYR